MLMRRDFYRGQTTAEVEEALGAAFGGSSNVSFAFEIQETLNKRETFDKQRSFQAGILTNSFAP